MPAPVWNWAPQRASGNFEAGFDRRRPDQVIGWSPAPGGPFPYMTEPGGGMLTGQAARRSGMAGMGSFFTVPQGQDAQAFFNQQVQQGLLPSMPPGPAIHAEPMDESAMFLPGAGPSSGHPGSMAWESGPAPWELPGAPPALDPSGAPAAIASMHAQQAVATEAKAIEAAQAAKIAADNAVRAAANGAPKVAATNAATAQAAANVAAGAAKTPKGQQVAALAQSEATKAVAAANVAANGARKAQGMNDWFELSGMGGLKGMGGVGHVLDQPVAFGLQVKHLLLGAAVGAAVYFKPWKKWGK